MTHPMSSSWAPNSWSQPGHCPSTNSISTSDPSPSPSDSTCCSPWPCVISTSCSSSIGGIVGIARQSKRERICRSKVTRGQWQDPGTLRHSVQDQATNLLATKLSRLPRSADPSQGQNRTLKVWFKLFVRVGDLVEAKVPEQRNTLRKAIVSPSLPKSERMSYTQWIPKQSHMNLLCSYIRTWSLKFTHLHTCKCFLEILLRSIARMN